MIHADATVVFSIDPQVRGGTALTLRLALEHNKPLLHLHAGLSEAEAAARLRAFLVEHHVKVLNIAGPRASQEPEVGAFVEDVLRRAIGMEEDHSSSNPLSVSQQAAEEHD